MERFRFAVTEKKTGNEIKVFLTCEAFEYDGLTLEKYNADEQLNINRAVWGDKMVTF